jgi:hypothetical protein
MIEGSTAAAADAAAGFSASAVSRTGLGSAVGAGAVAGLLDLTYAIAAWSTQGIPAKIIPLSVASGLLGKEAFSGGSGTIVLGVALHFLLAIVMAAAFVGAARSFPTLTSMPVRCGAAYGALIYLVMNFVVVPLSRAPINRPPLLMAAGDFLAHMLLVGVPIALIAARARS